MSIEQNTKILASDVVNSLSEKAPTSHASNDITYGVGTDTDYGHVKLSDSVSTLDSLSGTAVSPKAVDDGLSSLFDDIITAAENAANTTTVPDNVAVELSNRIDEIKSAIDTKLDITGGMMTGELKFAGRNASGYTITAYNEDLYQGLAINSNSTEHGRGATLALRNADTTNQDPGSFVLAARDPSTSVSLRGFIDGTLSWNGKNIVRSVNGVNADADGVVDIDTLTISDIYINGASSGSLTIPSGGTWRCHVLAKTPNGVFYSDSVYTTSGGSTVWTDGGVTSSASVFAVRIA